MQDVTVSGVIVTASLHPNKIHGIMRLDYNVTYIQL